MSLLSSSVRVNPSSSKLGHKNGNLNFLCFWFKLAMLVVDKEEAPNSCSSYSQRRHINVKRLTSSKLDWQRTTKLLHGAIAVVIRDERTSSRHGEEHLRN
ncbi:hypothetical protein IGI04_019481 [Brassica rapa subsp. trilocularis]|uniref:Uncharacterized protein n=1 Tax=Brassica rapa subsp. trilocularis TaxID=1813537 RepID=A0ABQ7MFY6_BRACM|nr:hypothetical protein IGI04_019481 [Brassica rapa subsp. trilocularis]